MDSNEYEPQGPGASTPAVVLDLGHLYVPFPIKSVGLETMEQYIYI